MRGRFVAEFAVVTGDSELLDQPERGKQLRLVEENLRENFLVKEIQAPGPEPDEINQEDREDDDEQRDDPENPL